MSRRSQHVLSVTGTVVAVFALIWAVFTWFVPADPSSPGTNVEAKQGVAAGGNIEGSKITIHGAPDDEAEGK